MTNVVQTFPAPSAPFVDVKTGRINEAWRSFLDALWRRTGGAQGAPAGSGTVTSVAAASTSGDIVVSGSPITVTGTLELDLAAQAGVTAGAGYNTFSVNAKGIVTAASAVSYQPLDADLTGLAALNTAAGDAGDYVQIGGAGTFAKRTPAQVRSDIGALSGNQTITLSGDVTGSGATAIAATLASVGTAGTYGNVTTDAKGRVTAGTKGWEPIASARLGANNATLIDTGATPFGNYDEIRCVINVAGYSGSDTIALTLNNLANSHQYFWETASAVVASGATVTRTGGANQATNAANIKLAPANTANARGITLTIHNSPEAAEKIVEISSVTGTGSTGSAPARDLCGAAVITAASTRITRIKLATAGGASLLAGSTVVIEGRNP